MNKQPVKDFNINENTNVKELLRQMSVSGGFSSKKVADALQIWKEMQKSDLRIISFPSCIISTGTRGVIKEIAKRKIANCFITTCGMLDHDIARTFSDYYHGSFSENDAALRKKHINREGNVLAPDKSYWKVEEIMAKILQECYKEKKEWAPYELVWKVGQYIEKNAKNKEESLCYWLYKNNIPCFIPGPLDGAFGYQIWLFWQDGHKDFNLSVLQDDQKLSEIIYDGKKAGALILGGGISKHHNIWWNQFRHGLDYAIQITTAVEYDGSLSGARLREAVSWGKIKPNAKHITIEGDVTVLLPLMFAGLISE
ncbi:deoxyhypusine synthase [Candidatus Pacearchaeota archaeon CG_4_10_14_0_2_um_filter_31_10]|nr:MAG: deoxyhypusine synthase [Candidatus Pacearchaeota archaeon CG10_big_fil_rev_8_21_14_0_10_31_59]PIZ80031.1 MAG: deoxyhypusine synthase [Candidatus Pacearchaeota archaeon CG_4_10_14_0_2_um_filter_31_10]